MTTPPVDPDVPQVQLFGLPGLPLVRQGDEIANQIADSLERIRFELVNGDVLVVAQKVVSKAEGAIVNLTSITPSQHALDLAAQTGRDPRLCQVYLDESSRILRVKGRMVITLHRLGYRCSGAGVDRSNVAPHADEVVVLLPKDPDGSARRIRDGLRARLNKEVAVIVSDSFGRDDRDGSVGMAIGIAGIGALEVRSQVDLFGNPSNPRIALIDELAAAGSILMGQSDEAIPVVLIRGVRYAAAEDSTIHGIFVEP